MRLQFVGEKEDFNLKDEITSEITKETIEPNKIFIDYLKCIE